MAPLVKLGTSFTALTVMVNVCAALVLTPPLAVPPLSDNVTVIVAAPLAFGAGVYVNVPLAATLGCTEKSAALVLLVTMNVSVWPDSSAGPALIAVAQSGTLCAAASSLTVWSAPLTKLGASFTAVTLMTKVCSALVSTPPFDMPPLSVSLTVIVADPLAFAAGVYVRVPLALIAGPAENSPGFVVGDDERERLRRPRPPGPR